MSLLLPILLPSLCLVTVPSIVISIILGGGGGGCLLLLWSPCSYSLNSTDTLLPFLLSLFCSGVLTHTIQMIAPAVQSCHAADAGRNFEQALCGGGGRASTTTVAVDFKILFFLLFLFGCYAKLVVSQSQHNRSFTTPFVQCC